eukprot:scaffold18767_cov54-Phaeocystis_antarctica.AAC.2
MNQKPLETQAIRNQKVLANITPPTSITPAVLPPPPLPAPPVPSSLPSSPLLPLLPPPSPPAPTRRRRSSPSQFSLHCVPGSIILTLNTLYLQTVRSAEIFG